MTDKELFDEINYHLLNDSYPAEYIDSISETPYFKKYPYTLLYKQKQTNQWLKYHPEGNVWNHTLLVVNQAAKIKYKSKYPQVLMWAAFLHDIGKPDTTKQMREKTTSYDHEIVGEKLTEEFLLKLGCGKEFIRKVKTLVRWHMQILFVTKNSRFACIAQMIKQTDIDEVALLGYCDRMGRTGADSEHEKQNIKLFIEKIKNQINKENKSYGKSRNETTRP